MSTPLLSMIYFIIIFAFYLSEYERLFQSLVRTHYWIWLKIALKWPILAIFWYILVVFGVYGTLFDKGVKVVKL